MEIPSKEVITEQKKINKTELTLETIKIEKTPINEIKPYKNNPRINTNAIEKVRDSILAFKFRNPILIDKNNEIIAGHTRLEAAKQLGLKEVPTIKIEDMTEAQVKAFRIADNKTAEFSEWDFDILKDEFHSLEDTDFFHDTGFKSEEITQIWDSDKDKIDVSEHKRELHKEIYCPNCNHDLSKFLKKIKLK